MENFFTQENECPPFRALLTYAKCQWHLAQNDPYITEACFVKTYIPVLFSTKTHF